MTESDIKPAEVPQPSDDRPVFLFVGLLVWAIIGSIIAWNTDSGRFFLRTYWWGVVGAITLIFLVLNMPAITSRLRILTIEARTALIVFGVLPVVVLLVVGIVLLPASYQSVAMRGVFLAIVVLLPATMYYLFIVLRKDSLLNEYIAVLDRLGLMRPERLKLQCEVNATGLYESLLGPRLRIETYLQRFEAAYGPIGVENRDDFVATLLRGFDPMRIGEDRRWSRKSPVGFTEVFNLATAVPVILATLLIALGWLMVLPPIPRVEGAVTYDGLRNSLNAFPGPVGFAFLGAYFFALQALFRRYVRRDLRASAYVSICIRIVLAVIGTWVVIECAAAVSRFSPETGLMSTDALTVTGFVLGVFPQVAWQFVRKVMSKVTFAEVALPSLSSQLPLSDLDGLTVWHESRLEEEDIENIANMATADLSDLMLNTRIARGRIVDWVDQAMLYVQVGPDAGESPQRSARAALRSHGIRTATSLLAAYDGCVERKNEAQIEKLMGDDPVGGSYRVRTLVDAINTSSNLDPILTWKGMKRSTPQGNAVTND